MKRRERQGRNRREEEEDEGDEIPAKRRRNIEEKVISQVFVAFLCFSNKFPTNALICRKITTMAMFPIFRCCQFLSHPLPSPILRWPTQSSKTKSRAI
jgi:hypothetical protein